MKKVLAVVLALVLVLSLTACGSKDSIVGTWKITAMTEDGKDALGSQGFTLAEIEAKGIYFGLEAKSDKTAVMKIAGEDSNLKWDDKAIYDDKDSSSYEVKDGVLTITGDNDGKKMVMTLKKMTEEEAKKFNSTSNEDIQNAITELVMSKIMSQLGEDVDGE